MDREAETIKQALQKIPGGENVSDYVIEAYAEIIREQFGIEAEDPPRLIEEDGVLKLLDESDDVSEKNGNANDKANKGKGSKNIAQLLYPDVT